MIGILGSYLNASDCLSLVSYTGATNIVKVYPSLIEKMTDGSHPFLNFRGTVKSKFNRIPNSVFTGS